jgi:hypothetical protein
VKVRLYLYEDQLPRGGRPAASLDDLRATPEGVEIRVKAKDASLMHLKAH